MGDSSLESQVELTDTETPNHPRFSRGCIRPRSNKNHVQTEIFQKIQLNLLILG